MLTTANPARNASTYLTLLYFCLETLEPMIGVGNGSERRSQQANKSTEWSYGLRKVEDNEEGDIARTVAGKEAKYRLVERKHT
jgi:hypothetical protein